MFQDFKSMKTKLTSSNKIFYLSFDSAVVTYFGTKQSFSKSSEEFKHLNRKKKVLFTRVSYGSMLLRCRAKQLMQEYFLLFQLYSINPNGETCTENGLHSLGGQSLFINTGNNDVAVYNERHSLLSPRPRPHPYTDEIAAFRFY